MCCDDGDNSGTPLTFTQFLNLLWNPPHPPCESELQHLTPAPYDAAFVDAIRLYRRRARSIVAHIIGDYEEAKDITQELFLSLYKTRASFEKAYIFQAARNKAYSEL